MPEGLLKKGAATHRASAAARAEMMLRDLKRRGLKMTPQRIAIVRLFASDDTHPTAQTLYDRLHAEFPSMSFATVYNTLDALAAAGLSGTLRLGSAARFDPNTDPHHHVVCDRCSAVRDIPSSGAAPSAATLRRLRRASPGFAVRAVERIYRGLCASCSVAASKGSGHASRRDRTVRNNPSA
jgi:Fur family peroxide stress response transcriptional regulator